MAHLLIWGAAHDILSGGVTPGPRPRLVSSFAALQQAVDGHDATLVLADAACLEPEREAISAWRKAGSAPHVQLVAVTGAEDAEAVAGRLPFVDEVELGPLTPARLRLKLERAVELAHSRRAIQQLESALGRKGEELSVLNRIGVALSAERDIEKLLELILSKSREITDADAGSLYLVERAGGTNGEGREHLSFKLAQNDTVDVPFEAFTMPLDETSIAGYVAVTGRVVNVADAYRPPSGSPFRISRAFDERSGYRSKSMLVVPMRDHENAVIGVVQLINKKRSPLAVLRPVSLVDEEVVSFTSVDEDLASSLASQAAVAFENAKLLEDIRRLFDSFVRASVTAIEQRDPTTSGHSERVATLTVGLAESLERVTSGPLAGTRLSGDQLRELRYAALLHDFGKVGVREKVLIKSKKLYYGQIRTVELRFAFIAKSLEAEHLRRKLELVSSGRAASPEVMAALDAEHAEKQADVARLFQAVLTANEPSVLERDTLGAVRELANRKFVDWHGQEQPFLSERELAALSIRKGSLSDEERQEIESHVSHTYEFLSQIPWTGEFSHIPEITWAHHEKLDGTGYPRGLKAPAIPLQSRMMAIADIYDALVAWDRPYKRAVSVERALAILDDEAKSGKLDELLLSLFVSARVFERTLPR
jgi:HD-GYP domain-containing protein (c-di-GMP phosphodiesterase class II)